MFITKSRVVPGSVFTNRFCIYTYVILITAARWGIGRLADSIQRHREKKEREIDTSIRIEEGECHLLRSAIGRGTL